MSIKDNIKKQLRDINLSTSYNLHLDSNQYKEDFLIYNYIDNGEEYYIYSKNEISQDEIKLLKILFSQILYDNEYNTHYNKLINNILKKDLNNFEIEKNLNSLNIDKEDNMIIISLKIKGEYRLIEAFEILINIEDVNLVTIFNGKLIILLINKKQNEALELSKLIVELIEIEILENIKIGISSLEPAINIKKLYDESIDSIKLSDEFKLEGNIYRYNELFIYKTISLIDDDNITYISRYIDKYNMKNLNKDEIKTARKFLDYSLNISEAAKNLYIHRNTLIYRLDKIKKITGMDLRNFDDSLKFKILLIIHNHINYTLRK